MLDNNRKHHRCPKCGGLLYITQDRYGRFEECIMCGYEYNLGVDKEKQQQQVEKLNRELGVII
jgi:DNA-directed RNA polymerase subunit M/transcription elongation factor TFIIS